jgi:hypothetical protein
MTRFKLYGATAADLVNRIRITTGRAEPGNQAGLFEQEILIIIDRPDYETITLSAQRDQTGLSDDGRHGGEIITLSGRHSADAIADFAQRFGFASFGDALEYIGEGVAISLCYPNAAVDRYVQVSAAPGFVPGSPATGPGLTIWRQVQTNLPRNA